MLQDEVIDAGALAAQREIVDQSNNITLPIIDPDKMIFPGADSREVLRLFRFIEWSPDREPDELEVEVFDRFVTLLPKLGLIAQHYDEDNAEFHWARVSCLVAGLGYAAHSHIVRRLRSLYPECPLDPQEDRKAWEDRIRKAHGLCGWPVTLAWVDFPDMCAVLGEIDKDTYYGAPNWTRSWLPTLALFHLLKHVRHDKGDCVCIYRGTATLAGYEPGTNMLGEMRRLRTSLTQALMIPRVDGRAKTAHPGGLSMQNVWIDLPMTALLQRLPLSALPGTVLANTWTELVPSPSNMQVGSFARTGMQLRHCWGAHEGKVTAIAGGHAEVLRFAWNVEPLPPETAMDRKMFASAVPARYSHTGYPTDALFAAFPNVNFGTMERDAVATMLDALVCTYLIRPEVAESRFEHPMFIALPTEPTPDDSTNQGKTTFAHCLARSMLLDIPCTMAKDVDGAPATRSLAASIEQYGSLCLDEYRPIKSRSHILAHDSLQALCTGQAVNVGKVMSNVENLVRLRNGICASAKCLSLPPDMVNRSLFLWLDAMSEEQRADVDTASAIQRGSVSIQMRLAAVACVERLGLVNAPAVASQEFRFPVIFGIACEIYKARKNCDQATAHDALTRALRAMKTHFEEHYRMAEDTGLASIQEDATAIRVRLVTLFETLSVDDMLSLEQVLNGRADDHGRLTPAALLKARGESVGMVGRGLAAVVSMLTGVKYSVGDRAVALALARDMTRLMDEPGARWWLPELLGAAGWYLERTTDAGGVTPRFRIHRDEERQKRFEADDIANISIGL